MKYSDHSIMSTLQSLRTWVTFNEFDTHRVASIGFLKYVSTGLTLHSTTKQRDVNELIKVNLNIIDILALQEFIPVITYSSTNNKCIPGGNRKDTNTQDNTIVFPAIDLSIKRVGFGNSTARLTTVAFEMRCNPSHATLLKPILIQAPVLDPVSPSNNHIHFIPYGLLQTTDAITVKNQFTQQNRFLDQTHPKHHSRHNEFRAKRTSTSNNISHRPRTNISHRNIRKMFNHRKKRKTRSSQTGERSNHKRYNLSRF